MEKETETAGSILIGHLADTHLRDTQYATARRGLDFFEAAKDAVEKGCQEADVLVLVGDLFDRARPSPRVIGQLMQLDRLLRSRGKLCIATTGNHDWCNPTWLSTLFEAADVEEGGTIDIPDDAAGIVAIDGVRATWRGFTFAGVRPYAAPAFRAKIVDTTVLVRAADVVLYHGFVDGVVPFYAGSKNPLHVAEFPIDKCNKAWLLGDIHLQGFMTVGRPGGEKTLVGYPGSTEMCSASEPAEKSMPLIRLSRNAAAVEKLIPIATRPFVAAEVATVEQLDALMAEVTPLADSHPVVICKFNRELTQTINRLHSTLDAQRAVIRCHPLPSAKKFAKREEGDEGSEDLTMEHFVSKRFEGRDDMQAVSIALLHRGETDTEGIITGFIEERLASVAVREEG